MRCVLGCIRVFLSDTSDQFLCPAIFLYNNNMVIKKTNLLFVLSSPSPGVFL